MRYSAAKSIKKLDTVYVRETKLFCPGFWGRVVGTEEIEEESHVYNGHRPLKKYIFFDLEKFDGTQLSVNHKQVALKRP